MDIVTQWVAVEGKWQIWQCLILFTCNSEDRKQGVLGWDTGRTEQETNQNLDKGLWVRGCIKPM